MYVYNGWGGWVKWSALERYEWIGKRGESGLEKWREELHHYMIFVTLKENI